MYRPPLVSFMAATTASVEMPANTPAGIGASPSRWPRMKPNSDAHHHLGGEQRAALLEDVGRRLHVDAGAHANVEHRQDRQRAGEQRPGEGAEELRRVREERVDQRAGQQRHDHHAAGNALDRLLDGDCLMSSPPGKRYGRNTQDWRGARADASMLPSSPGHLQGKVGLTATDGEAGQRAVVQAGRSLVTMRQSSECFRPNESSGSAECPNCPTFRRKQARRS